MSRPDLSPDATDVGQMLRVWRRRRGYSQLDLAVEAGVSQRHVSFVENGRSAPSRQLLQDLARALDIPLREQDLLLLAGGFAPMSRPGQPAPPDDMVRLALERVLSQNEPYPALVMDRYWNVVFTNAAAPVFFGSFVDLSQWPAPRNLLHLLFGPNGLRPAIRHFDTFADSMLQRVRREAVGSYLDETTLGLVDYLRGQICADPVTRRVVADRPVQPVVPLTLCHGERELSYFSLVTTVGTPNTVTTQEWRMECMVPADEATRAHHPLLMAELGHSLPER